MSRQRCRRWGIRSALNSPDVGLHLPLVNQNNFQLVLFAAIFGLSILSWVVGKVREQAEIKRQRDAARRRMEEQLRTGRAEPAPSPTTAAQGMSAQELAARRQAQLQELRRQQAEKKRAALGATLPMPVPGGPGGLGGPGGAGAPHARAPMPRPAKPTVRPAGQAAATPTRPAQRPTTQPTTLKRPEQLGDRPARDPAPVRRGPAEPTRRRPPEAREPARLLYDEPAEPVVSRASRFAPPAAAAPPRVAEVAPRTPSVRALLFGTGGEPRRSDELRRLFALQEVLGAPLSMRDEPGR